MRLTETASAYFGYYAKYESRSSQIFRTLKINELTKSNLESLYLFPNFQWCFMNESVGHTMIELIEFQSSFETKLLIQSKCLEEEREIRKELLGTMNELKEEMKSLKQEQRKKITAVENNLMKQQKEEHQKLQEL